RTRRPFSTGRTHDEPFATGDWTGGGDSAVVRASGAARSGRCAGRGSTGRAGNDSTGGKEQNDAVVVRATTAVAPFAVARAGPGVSHRRRIQTGRAAGSRCAAACAEPDRGAA